MLLYLVKIVGIVDAICLASILFGSAVTAIVEEDGPAMTLVAFAALIGGVVSVIGIPLIFLLA